MAGVPSIVYGFFGLILIVPLIRQIFGGTGTSMLAACVSAWNDDPADYHRSYGICDPQRT